MSNRELKTILTGFSLILFISLYYNISKSTLNTTAENIQAVVSMITLIVSIVTIYFVYKAYQSQNEQIAIQKKELEEGRKDVEFNRALDMFYKQIEYSKHRIAINNLEPIIKAFIENTLNTFYILDLVYSNLGIKEFIKISKIFRVLSEDLRIYNNILIQTNVNESDKLFLMQLVIDNIFPKLSEAINIFQSSYRDFQGGQAYKEMEFNNPQMKKVLNDIEFDFGNVLSYVKIKQIKGLHLEG